MALSRPSTSDNFLARLIAERQLGFLNLATRFGNGCIGLRALGGGLFLVTLGTVHFPPRRSTSTSDTAPLFSRGVFWPTLLLRQLQTAGRIALGLRFAQFLLALRQLLFADAHQCLQFRTLVVVKVALFLDHTQLFSIALAGLWGLKASPSASAFRRANFGSQGKHLGSTFAYTRGGAGFVNAQQHLPCFHFLAFLTRISDTTPPSNDWMTCNCCEGMTLASPLVTLVNWGQCSPNNQQSQHQQGGAHQRLRPIGLQGRHDRVSIHLEAAHAG